ncbi:MAG: Uma2 family endonuclease [Gammaproteobacteria bacterium]|nr:Uma2 family endonuclease [Gammaproteobacteria bacterium]
MDEDTHSDDGRLVPEAIYWEEYYGNQDIIYEWNNGRIEEKTVSDYMNYMMYKWFLIAMDQFLGVHPVAKMLGLEIGFRMVLPYKTAVRKPDLAVVRNDNSVLLLPNDHSYHGIYDLCVEALSDSRPGEIERDTVTKKTEYAGAGVKEYYILYAGEGMAFYRLASGGEYVAIEPVGDGLIQSEVLPGFQFRISDLYRQPSLAEMAEDPVYEGFILPFHQEVKNRAMRVEQWAKTEEQRALREAQRADIEARRADRAEQELGAANMEIVRLKRLLNTTETPPKSLEV